MRTCMKCGGMKKAKAGIVVDDPSKREIRKSMREINQTDRQDRRFMKKYERQLEKDQRNAEKIKANELMKSKRFKKGGITQDIVGMPGYNATTRPITMKKGGAKNAKLAAVAPPKDKVTRRDVLTKILRKKK